MVAIVAAILDSIDEKTHLIPDDCKTKLKGVCKAIGTGVIHKASDWVKEKTGIDTEELIDVVSTGNKTVAEKIEKEHLYDTYFIFKKALLSLQKEIRDLSQYQTVIFVVDELDRCLPQYAIKVLERLHHVFDGIPNVQVVMSIDKTQLTHTVKQIFGDDTDVKKYLSKFLKFEVNLESGSFNALFDEKFAYYLNQFEYVNGSNTAEADIAEFKAHIFDGIDMRSRIEIIDKCCLLHTVLTNADEKQDCSYMCAEIFLTMLNHFEINPQTLPSGFNMQQLFVKNGAKSNPSLGLDFLSQKLCRLMGHRYYYLIQDEHQKIIRNTDIWGVIFGCYIRIFGFLEDAFYYSNANTGVFDYAETYNKLLQVIN